MSQAISSKQIVLGALQGQAVPRIPCGPLAVHFCARQAGVSLRDYTLCPRTLADCVLRYYDRFRPDAVWISADTWVTAQAMGAAVAFPGENQPLAGTARRRIASAADIDHIPPPDPGSQGRCPLMLEALGRVAAALGDEVCIVACFDQYPFSLGCALMGMETLMFALWDDRPLVEALLERCAEYSVAYARAMARAGADVLSGGDSPAGLIGPRLYREVALPYERRVTDALHAGVPQPVTLHICGNALPILADMGASGADALELDHQVEMAAACRTVGPGVGIWGNLDPVGLLARGTPEQVRAAATAVLDTAAACGQRRFVLSSGCTLAVDTPPENLDALLETARCRRPADVPSPAREGAIP